MDTQNSPCPPKSSTFAVVAEEASKDIDSFVIPELLLYTVKVTLETSKTKQEVSYNVRLCQTRAGCRHGLLQWFGIN